MNPFSCQIKDQRRYYSDIGRVNNLLIGIPHEIRTKFSWTHSSIHTMTGRAVGISICDTLIRLGVGNNSSVTDLMASIGGNTIPFAQYFNHVAAIELDSERFESLCHNIKLFGLSNIDLYNGFYQDILPALTQDIIFIDPPWGRGYKKYATGSFRIFIPAPTGEIALEQLLRDICTKCRYCVIKLPINYDMLWLDYHIYDIAHTMNIIYHTAPNSCIILTIRYI